jgi:hypothetical protein
MYNSGIVTANNDQSYTIDANAYYILYQRVGGTPTPKSKNAVNQSINNVLAHFEEEGEEETTGQGAAAVAPIAEGATAPVGENNNWDPFGQKNAPVGTATVGPATVGQNNNWDPFGQKEQKNPPMASATPKNPKNAVNQSINNVLAHFDTEEEEEISTELAKYGLTENTANEQIKQAIKTVRNGKENIATFKEWLERKIEKPEYGQENGKSNKNNKSKTKPKGWFNQPIGEGNTLTPEIAAQQAATKPKTPFNSLTAARAKSAGINLQPVNTSKAKATTPVNKKGINNLMAARAQSVKKTGGKSKAETLKRREALTKRKLKGGRKTFKKANSKKVRISRKKNKST